MLESKYNPREQKLWVNMSTNFGCPRADQMVAVEKDRMVVAVVVVEEDQTAEAEEDQTVVGEEEQTGTAEESQTVEED